MEVVELTGAIVKEAELSDERLCWGFCSGLGGVDNDGEECKDGRPSAPSSTGCFQEKTGDDEGKARGCLLTRSQSELRAFNRGRRPSMQSQGNWLKIIRALVP